MHQILQKTHICEENTWTPDFINNTPKSENNNS